MSQKHSYLSLTGTPFDKWQWILSCVAARPPLKLCIQEDAILSAAPTPEIKDQIGEKNEHREKEYFIIVI